MGKKQIGAILLYEFKMGHKVEETANNINQAFGQETINKHTTHHWFQKFCNGDESFEDGDIEAVKIKMGKTQIRGILLYEFKMRRKAAKAARNINQAFGQGTVNNRTAQYWFQKFRNGDESLEDEGGRGRPSGINNSQLKAIIEANPHKTTRKIGQELKVDHSTVVRHLHQIGKSKKLDTWVPKDFNEKQKI